MRDPSRDTPIEAEIQTLIANGEFDEAFNSAYKAYRGEIDVYCINALRGYVSSPEADGEDLAQEIFSEFSCKLPTKYVSSIASTRTFLFLITKRRVIDEVRALKRSVRNHDIALMPCQSCNLESMLLEKEKKELVDQAIEELTGIERVIIKLYLEEISKAEIADFIGKSEGAIRARHSRIVTKIRNKICRDSDFPDLYPIKAINTLQDRYNTTEPIHENISIGFWDILKTPWFILCDFCFILCAFSFEIWNNHLILVREYIKALFMRK